MIASAWSRLLMSPVIAASEIVDGFTDNTARPISSCTGILRGSGACGDHDFVRVRTGREATALDRDGNDAGTGARDGAQRDPRFALARGPHEDSVPVVGNPQCVAEGLVAVHVRRMHHGGRRYIQT